MKAVAALILATLAAACSAGPDRVSRGPTGVAICGDPAIRGERVPPIPGRIEGCGIEAPVEVYSVAGVTLSQPATVECGTARALKTWVEDGARPVLRRRGGGLSELRVAASYACRTRNSQPGAKVSEHALGRAIDISAFTLRDGTEISVLDHWDTWRRGRLLRRMHEAACGPFGTVLGPESDRFHRDHFHFDIASYRSGSYCR